MTKTLTAKPIQKVGFDKLFHFFEGEKMIWHVRNGVDAGREHDPKLKVILGINVCVGNMMREQKLVDWDTIVYEISEG